MTCKKHLPSSLFRQGASQCRPVLPRANSAIEKQKDSPSVELQVLPSPHHNAPGHSILHKPTHSRAWQPAVLLQGGSPAPIVGQGAAPRVTPFHPPAHHRAGPQPQLITPWGYRGILPTSSLAAPHTPLFPKLQDQGWPSGPHQFSPLKKTTRPQNPAQDRVGLAVGIVQLQQPPLPWSRAGQGLEGGRRGHSPSSHFRAG